jgi:hypothetical protein
MVAPESVVCAGSGNAVASEPGFDSFAGAAVRSGPPGSAVRGGAVLSDRRSASRSSRLLVTARILLSSAASRSSSRVVRSASVAARRSKTTETATGMAMTTRRTPIRSRIEVETRPGPFWPDSDREGLAARRRSAVLSARSGFSSVEAMDDISRGGYTGSPGISNERALSPRGTNPSVGLPCDLDRDGERSESALCKRPIADLDESDVESEGAIDARSSSPEGHR